MHCVEIARAAAKICLRIFYAWIGNGEHRRVMEKVNGELQRSHACLKSLVVRVAWCNTDNQLCNLAQSSFSQTPGHYEWLFVCHCQKYDLRVVHALNTANLLLPFRMDPLLQVSLWVKHHSSIVSRTEMHLIPRAGAFGRLPCVQVLVPLHRKWVTERSNQS